MANSQLQSKLSFEAGSSPNRWGTPDAAVELLLNALGSIGGSPGDPVTETSVNHTTDFTIAAGSLMVELFLSPYTGVATAFTGTINGLAFSGDDVGVFQRSANGAYVLPAYAFVVTTGAVKGFYVLPPT